LLINEKRISNPEYYQNIPSTDMPTNYADLRRYVLDGKYAIFENLFENLPHPMIYHERKYSQNQSNQYQITRYIQVINLLGSH
jgi:hypothetical protein